MIHTIPETKHCIACNNTKSSVDFSRDRARPDGLSTYCSQCLRNPNRPKKQRRDLANSTQQCLGCGRTLVGSMFVPSTTESGLATKCRTCKSYIPKAQPTLSQIEAHEAKMKEIFTIAMEDLIAKYDKTVAQIRRQHRSEFEQMIWSHMAREKLLATWKLPVWVHPTSIPD